MNSLMMKLLKLHTLEKRKTKTKIPQNMKGHAKACPLFYPANRPRKCPPGAFETLNPWVQGLAGTIIEGLELSLRAFYYSAPNADKSEPSTSSRVIVLEPSL